MLPLKSIKFNLKYNIVNVLMTGVFLFYTLNKQLFNFLICFSDKVNSIGFSLDTFFLINSRFDDLEKYNLTLVIKFEKNKVRTPRHT